MQTIKGNATIVLPLIYAFSIIKFKCLIIKQ